jgi:integrase
MPGKQRFKTKYPGVYYIESQGAEGPEKVYYIQYRLDGKLIEEKAGRQFQGMTPGKATGMRALRIDGKELPNSQRRAAEKAAKEAEAGKWTLTKLWESYKAQKPDSKSVRTDSSRFEKYLKPALGKKEPSEVAPLDVDRVRITVSKNHSPQTVKHVLVLLKRIVNYGLEKSLCTGLSFKIKAPRVDNEKTEFLTDAQVESLLNKLKEWPDRQTANMMLLSLLTGLRRGELYKLQWQDIDFERGFIYIREPKGGKSEHIPLNSAAANVLKNHPRISDVYIFSHEDGRPYSDGAHNYRQLREVRKVLDLPNDFRPLHGLRHQFASALASSGKVDMYTLQKLLTHKSPVMTQRHTHLRDEALRQASDLAGDIINQAMTGRSQEDSISVPK